MLIGRVAIARSDGGSPAYLGAYVPPNQLVTGIVFRYDAASLLVVVPRVLELV